MTAVHYPQAGRREWIGLAVLALACLLYVMDLTVLHLAVPAISADLRPTQRPAAVDHRHLRVLRRRLAHHDGHARRPHRPAPPAADRRRGLRCGLGARRVLHQRRDADRQPRAAGRRRRDAGPLDAVADLPHVPRPAAALDRDRRVDRQLLGGRRGRPGARRRPAGALLVGLGVPAGPAGDGRCCSCSGPRVLPEYRDPNAGRLDLAQRRDVAGRRARRDLRPQGDRPGRARLPVRSPRSPSGSSSARAVRAPPAPPRRPDDRRRACSASARSTRRCATNFLAIFVAFGYFLFVAQYLQLVLGLSPLEAGLWSLPSAVGFIVGSQARAADRAAGCARRTLIGGGLAVGRGRAGVLTQVGATERAAAARHRLGHHLAGPGAGLRR